MPCAANPTQLSYMPSMFKHHMYHACMQSHGSHNFTILICSIVYVLDMFMHLEQKYLAIVKYSSVN